MFQIIRESSLFQNVHDFLKSALEWDNMFYVKECSTKLDDYLKYLKME